jgi:hypothetical protein
MEHFQQEYLQRKPLTGIYEIGHRALKIALCIGILSAAQAQVPASSPIAKSIEIPHLLSGRGLLEQDGRKTVLVLTAKDGTTTRTELTHRDEYPQGFNPPYAAHVIAEDPGQLLIFTDTFASNPGNPQGQCGASSTGERFLHVVSLRVPPRESLSVLIESCWRDIEPRVGMAQFDRSSRTLTLRFKVNDGKPLTSIFHIAADNSVTESRQ